MNLPATGIALVDQALALLVAHAYVITFAVAALENVFVIGAVTPGETTILAAGFVASASHTDTIFALGVFMAALLGSVLGSNVTYVLGRRGGRPLLERYGQRFSMGARHIQDAEAYFERHGTKTIVLARFAPGIKAFAPLLAGVSHMNMAVFELYTVAGSALYCGLMVALGYFFGSNLPLLLKIVQRLGWVALGLAALLLGAWIWERRRIIRKRQEREALDAEDGRERLETGSDAAE
jgi:membrane protein DedA with SNARE-associated domain